MKTKITVIGAGNVGSTIAFMMSVQHTADEVVIVDINQEKAMGEAMDIRQGTPFCAPIQIYAGTYADAEGSDVVIVPSGVARKPGQTRMDLAQTNVNVIKDIAPQITKYCPDATYIIVSNPVDILTYVFHKVSNIPHERIIGSGTLLDTARLRSRLSDYLNVSQQNTPCALPPRAAQSSWSAAATPWARRSTACRKTTLTSTTCCLTASPTVTTIALTIRPALSIASFFRRNRPGIWPGTPL